MTAAPKSDQTLIITDPSNVSITYINQVVGCGHLNGVANITLAVARFTPNASGKVDPDLVIASRLRMDMPCLAQLHEQIGQILGQAMATAMATTAAPGKSGPN